MSIKELEGACKYCGHLTRLIKRAGELMVIDPDLWSIACIDVALDHIDFVHSEIDRLTKERDELKKWKDWQLEVESAWNPQEVAKKLGIPYGMHIRPNILPFIEKLTKERDELKEENTRLLVNRNDLASENTGLKERLRPIEEISRRMKEGVYDEFGQNFGSDAWEAIKRVSETNTAK